MSVDATAIYEQSMIVARVLPGDMVGLWDAPFVLQVRKNKDYWEPHPFKTIARCQTQEEAWQRYRMWKAVEILAGRNKNI